MLDELYIINSGMETIDLWRQVEEEENDDIIDILILMYLLYSSHDLNKRLKLNIAVSKHYANSQRRIKTALIKTKYSVKRELTKSAQKSHETDDIMTYKPNNEKVSELDSSERTEVIKDNTNKTVNEIDKNMNNVPDNMLKELNRAVNEFETSVDIFKIDYVDAVIKSIDYMVETSTYTFINNGNRKAHISADVKRVVQMSVNRTGAEITLKTAIKNGFDYILVSAHFGARVNPLDPVADHAGWQGKPYKIVGFDDYADNLLEKTGYPLNPLGLLGYNCRHSFTPHKKGMKDPFEEHTQQQYADTYKKIKYQRELERRIRLSKQKARAYNKVYDTIKDTKIKSKLDHYTQLAQRQNKEYLKYCESNELDVSKFNLKI